MEGPVLTFRELKKRMTEEQMAKNRRNVMKANMRFVQRVSNFEQEGLSSSSYHEEEIHENGSSLDDDDFLMLIRSNNTDQMVTDAVQARRSKALRRQSSQTSVSEKIINGVASISIGLQSDLGLLNQTKKFLPKIEIEEKCSSEEDLSSSFSGGNDKENSSFRSRSSSKESNFRKVPSSARSKKSTNAVIAESVGVLVKAGKANKIPSTSKEPTPRATRNYRPRYIPPVVPSSSSSSDSSRHANAAKNKPKRFFTSVRTRTLLSKNSTGNRNSDFQYHLSAEESKAFVTAKRPMKDVPEKDKKILSDGKRNQYLEKRKEKGPASKYYFPQATSFRYGWLVDG